MKIFIFLLILHLGIQSNLVFYPELNGELFWNLTEYNIGIRQRDDCFGDLDLIFKVTCAVEFSKEQVLVSWSLCYLAKVFMFS